jgi:hypothetical protein
VRGGEGKGWGEREEENKEGEHGKMARKGFSSCNLTRVRRQRRRESSERR